MQKIYAGNIHADPIHEMRDPSYVHELMCFYVWLDESGDLTVDWILDQLFSHHSGSLFDPRGRTVDIEALAPEDRFGIDTRGCINKMKKKAKRRPKQAAHRSKVTTIMLMDFARMIYLNRID